jgi:hypothetical protein
VVRFDAGILLDDLETLKRAGLAARFRPSSRAPPRVCGASRERW